MSRRFATFWLRVLLPALIGAGGLTGVFAADDPAKPAMTLIMERGEILADQTVGMAVFVENPTAAPLSEVRLRYAGPRFLTLGSMEPDGKSCRAGGKDIDLGTVEAGTALERRLCLQAASAVEERDVSLAFSLVYKTAPKGAPVTSGFLVAEKRLSVGLFGTESVGGVSLRLAAYVVPGLLLMMILRLGEFPWIEKLGGVEVATLSVVASVILFYLVGMLPGAPFVFAGIGSSVSAAEFIALSALAIVIGLIGVGIHRAIAARALRQRRALMVEVGDNDVVVLEKALRGAKGEFQPVTVVTREQERFVGALMAPTASGGVALVGWFALELAENDARRAELAPMIAESRFLDALLRARELSIAPIMENPVRSLSAAGGLGLTQTAVRRFVAREILESSHGEVSALAGQLPLILKAP